MPDDRADLIADAEVVELYDAPPASTLPDMPPEQTFRAPGGGREGTLMLRNVSQPTLTVFRPDPAKANGIGVIVAPGGGWRILAWEHEGIELARWLAARGYSAFLLKYRLQATPPDPDEFLKTFGASNAALTDWASKPARELPTSIGELFKGKAAQAAQAAAHEDGRRALALIRERAAEWGVTGGRVGMIGFSAGAFLTADVAMQPGGPPLAFAAPIYGGESRGWAIPADAPPMFLAIAADDFILRRTVESLYTDWTLADRPAELHIYRRGGHGFGMTPQNTPIDRWLPQFADWLTDQGLG